MIHLKTNTEKDTDVIMIDIGDARKIETERRGIDMKKKVRDQKRTIPFPVRVGKIQKGTI